MSDEELRRLERRFRETGTAEDEVGWLTARLRGGSLTGARLEIAALLGHEASRRLLPRIKPPIEVAPIFKALQRRAGGTAVLRAMLALTRRLDDGSRESEVHRKWLDEIEAWLLEPAKGIREEERSGGTPFELAALMCCEQARHAERGDAYRDYMVRVTTRTLTPPQCLDAIGQELIPWAIGLRDPVAERVRRTTQ